MIFKLNNHPLAEGKKSDVMSTMARSIVRNSSAIQIPMLTPNTPVLFMRLKTDAIHLDSITVESCRTWI